jgi:diguanylate cyclase (GGDEF)-like protein
VQARSRRRAPSLRAGRIRPHQRVLLVTLVAVMGAGTGLGLMMALSRAPRNDLKVVTQRLEPIASDLAQVANETRIGVASFQDALSAPDLGARTVVLQLAAKATQDSQKSWTAYRKLALGLPGEKALQAQYDEQSKVSRDAGVVLFTTDKVSNPFQYAAAALSLRQSSETTQRVVAKLANDYEHRIVAAEQHAGGRLDRLRHDFPIVVAGLVLFGLLVAGWMLRGAVKEERLARRRDRERERQIGRSDLETRVQRGLEMTHTEEPAYEVVGSALRHVMGERPAELLIADSSRAHFRRVLQYGPTEDGCAVTAPVECPAAHTGQIRVFESSEDIDACPFLRNRPVGSCAAACIPLSVAGRSIGVMHVGGGNFDPPPTDAVADLTLVAQRAGEHIGLLRAMARTETQARTDSLTGLFNRRSIESAAHQLVRDGSSFVVAFADLDHFKVLNDAHGHETGDRALRLFARVLRDSVRPTDVPARYGGEEFVVVLPDCSVHDAVAVAHRLRGRLADALRDANVPPFTVSVGIARSGPDNGLTETVARADEALLAAKAAGRDRVWIFSGDAPETAEDATAEPDAPVAPPALRLHA